MIPIWQEKPWFKSYPKGVPQEIDANLYQNILQVLDEACSKFRTREAFTNMGHSITYDELDRLSGDMASFFQNELGLKKGDRIAIQLPNLLQFPIVCFGALRAGLIVVNTNPLYTAKEMEHQFRDSGAKAVVILANFASHLEQIIKKTSIESVIVTEIGDMLPFPKSLLVNSVVKYVKKMVPSFKIPQAYSFRQALEIGSMTSLKKVDVRQEDLAFLQYTGGTTGVAKGAMLSHKNVVANMLQICEWMKPALVEGQEIALTPLPMYHIFSLTVNTLAFMRFGTQSILITNPRDIPAFVKEMKKYPFTIMSGVNTLFNALTHNADFQTLDLSRMKICVAGAMALQKPVAERWQQVTKTKVIEGYGLTEASPVVCCNPIDGRDRLGTIGLPVPSTEVRLCKDDGQECGPNEAGELCVRGPQVMMGYWQRADETEKVLSADGWLKTGDVAEFDSDGYCRIVDRKKDLILVSGFNVYPNEVEEAIASHPGVLEVAAIGVPDEHSGEIVKVVIVKKDPGLTDKDVIEHAKQSLTGYKVPKVVEFRKELPKTNVGKILRRALREAPASP